MAAHTDWLAMFSPFLALSLDFCALLFPPESHRNIWTSNVFSGSLTEIGIDVRPDRYSYLGHLIPASNSTKFWNSFVFFFVTSFWSIQLFFCCCCAFCFHFPLRLLLTGLVEKNCASAPEPLGWFPFPAFRTLLATECKKKSHFMGMIFFIFRK